MKKLFFVFTLAMSALHFTSAQSAQSVFFELGGPGIASFNYDLRFSGRSKGLGGRIGFGSSLDGNSIYFLPLGLNYLIGKERHFFEVGAGITPVFGNENPGDSALSKSFGHLLFGYRFQPINEGFTFRAFVCPVFNSNDFVPYYAGLSLGYKF
jgi:hypothetical protein